MWRLHREEQTRRQPLMPKRIAYSEEAMQEILCRISAGESLKAICKERHLPSREVVYGWLDKQSALYDRYARAREIQADSHFDAITDAAKDVLKGELDPNQARVAIDAMKWTASRLKPREYGDKSELKVEQTNGSFFEALRIIDEREKRERLAAQHPGVNAIDITPNTGEANNVERFPAKQKATG